MEKSQSGKLYICGTPIGNLEDITLRCLATLKEVDLIAAEDTRHTKILLNHYHIEKPLTSYHKFSKEKKIDSILQLLKDGKDIAILSDAGMPGICDPGFEIINRAIENNIDIIPIPGVSALTTALTISGFRMDSFLFEGFIPRKKGEKERLFNRLKDEERTIIFYEAPHRIKDSLLTMKKIFGERRIVLARELTKKFEEVLRGNISDILNILQLREIKGEITLLIEGKKSKTDEMTSNDKMIINESELEQVINEYLKKGCYNKDIVSLVTKEYHISKKWVYDKVVQLKRNSLD